MWVVDQHQSLAIDCDLIAIEPCQSQEIGLMGKFELIGRKGQFRAVLARGGPDEIRALLQSILSHNQRVIWIKQENVVPIHGGGVIKR